MIKIRKDNFTVVTPHWVSFCRSNHWRFTVGNAVFRNFSKFTGKRLCQGLFFNEVAGLPAPLLKKRLCHRCFPANFEKFLGTPFLQNTSDRLLLFLLGKLYHVAQRGTLIIFCCGKCLLTGFMIKILYQ